MTDLDREMLRHLRAYRGETRPTPAQRDSALAGLMQRVRAGQDVDLDDEEPSIAAVAGPSRIKWAVAAASIALVVAGTALLVAKPVELAAETPASSAAVYGGGVDAPSGEVVTPVRREAPSTVSRRDPAPRPPTPAPALAPAPLELAAPAVSPSRAAVARLKPKPEPAPLIEPSIDAAEVAALRRAQALLGSAPADALIGLVDHASKYPSSSLAAEREIARVTALCNLGRVEDARARAQAFEEQRPDSPLLSRMRRICSDPRR